DGHPHTSWSDLARPVRRDAGPPDRGLRRGVRLRQRPAAPLSDQRHRGDHRPERLRLARPLRRRPGDPDHRQPVLRGARGHPANRRGRRRPPRHPPEDEPHQRPRDRRAQGGRHRGHLQPERRLRGHRAGPADRRRRARLRAERAAPAV
ncbi:MAG: hypothetical protein AVDCRST_MAG30-756, partial [uncultured Solirubrobacteraceae bacterium]